MPAFKKPNTNKFEARSGAPRGSGGQAPTHRGYKADAAAPAKKRWTADDRAARTGDRPVSNSRRPEWSPRDSKPAYGDRPNRAGSGRPTNGDRPGTSDRPARPSYNDRNDRPATDVVINSVTITESD